MPSLEGSAERTDLVEGLNSVWTAGYDSLSHRTRQEHNCSWAMREMMPARCIMVSGFAEQN